MSKAMKGINPFNKCDALSCHRGAYGKKKHGSKTVVLCKKHYFSTNKRSKKSFPLKGSNGRFDPIRYGVTVKE